jgi:hypothetical protein
MLADPSRNRFSLREMVRTVFDVGYLQVPTEAQRVSVGRAFRKILAGSNEWRVVADDRGGTKHLIRERPAPASNDKVVIWAYRFTLLRLEWEPATIVRRTRTRCTIQVGATTIVTNAQLSPSQPEEPLTSGWYFLPRRDALAERMAAQGYQMWRNTAEAFSPDDGGRAKAVDAGDLACSLLNVGRDATQEEVQQAYRAAMQRHHPDHGGDDAVARTLTMARDTLLAHSALAARHAR